MGCLTMLALAVLLYCGFTQGANDQGSALIYAFAIALLLATTLKGKSED